MRYLTAALRVRARTRWDTTCMSNSAAANNVTNERSATQINSTKTSHSELLANSQSSW